MRRGKDKLEVNKRKSITIVMVLDMILVIKIIKITNVI